MSRDKGQSSQQCLQADLQLWMYSSMHQARTAPLLHPVLGKSSAEPPLKDSHRLQSPLPSHLRLQALRRRPPLQHREKRFARTISM